MADYLRVPGLDPVRCRGPVWPDLWAFFVIAVLPTSFFGLVSHKVFYKVGAFDLSLFAFLCSLPYFAVCFSNLGQVAKLPGGVSLILLCGVLTLFLVESILQGIPAREALTVFRKNSLGPIQTLGILLYCSAIGAQRLRRLMYWVFLANFLQGCLYIFSNLTRLDVFSAKLKEFSEFQRVTLQENLMGLPVFGGLLFCLALVDSLLARRLKATVVWSILFVTFLLSSVRSAFLGLASSFLWVEFLLFWKRRQARLGGTILTAFVLFSAIGAYILAFPLHSAKFSQKAGIDLSSGEIDIVGRSGTYEYRKELIRIAFRSIRDENKLLRGMGYVRYALPGEPDFVLGTDTYIAPVLYTEGLFGMAVRILPIFILAFSNIRSFLDSKQRYYCSITVIPLAIIASALLNWVQTGIFTNYHYGMLMLLLLQIIRRSEPEPAHISQGMSACIPRVQVRTRKRTSMRRPYSIRFHEGELAGPISRRHVKQKLCCQKSRS